MFNIKKLVVLLLCAGLVFQAHFGIAGPQGGKVVGGNANISQSGPNTTINQTSDRGIINWNSFDIGKNESVRHNMPSSNSAGLHRVVGKGGPSQIEGLLQSNGNIYLVNPAGVVIHNGAKIDVNGFVATSRDIANDNFMKGKMVFDKPGLPGAAIINQGNISLRDNGLAALVAPTVRNDGIIAGKLGKVALGGSDAAWKLDMTGDDLIAFTMDEKQVNTLYAADGTPLVSVQNNGKIKAEGGVVVLTASQLDSIVGSVVNNGEISAASAEMKGGKIIFRGQGNKVDVVNNGHLDVSSKTAEGGNVRMTGQSAVTHAGKIDATGKTKGGNVVITGENVTLKSGSRIDASGTNGGGTVLVGGNARGKGPEANAKTTLVQSDAEILADAKLYGDGGQIVVWADEKTQFDGKATARGGENGGIGGMVETSAKLLIIGDPAVVNTSAKRGRAGEWLLDPEDFVIAAAGGTMTGEQISDSLNNNNVTIETGGDGEGNGNIFVNDTISWNSDRTLALNSANYIYINSDIIILGDNSRLTINSKIGSKRYDEGIKINNSCIKFVGYKQQLVINDKNYNIIDNVEDLEKLRINPDDNYALGRDIDGQNIEFLSFDYFDGKLNGLGNKVNNIVISSNDTTNIGLFAVNFGKISNINFENMQLNISDVSQDASIGIIVGTSGMYSKSVLYNIYVNGIITNYNSYVTNMGGIIGTNYDIIDKVSSNVYINTRDGYSIGGLVGCNIGIISNSCSFANIKYNAIGRYAGDHLGGFVGYNTVQGKIDNSYSRGIIDVKYDQVPIENHYGSYDGGGFVGCNETIINNSYSSVLFTNYKYIEDGFDILMISTAGFAGRNGHSFSSSKAIINNCYWDLEYSKAERGIGSEAGDSHSSLTGLHTDEMKVMSSFNKWDFNTIWKIDEGKSYPELRGIANNNIVLPDKPVDPTPPIVDPDPDPKPDPDPNPEGPDNPNPKPDTPDTPDNPDVPVDPDPKPGNPDNPVNPEPKPDTPDTPDNPDVPANPDPKPDAPVNPDKPVNPDPKPDTPVTPEQPSNPGTNPGDTPTQPSTKPDTKPDTPVVPEQPSKPVQPENPVNPEQPSNPGTTPGGNTPSQPDTKPETPVTPNQPSNPGNNPGTNNSNTGNTQFPTGTTITYKVIDGNVHVFQDNQHIGIMEGNIIKVDNHDIPVEIEDGKTYVTGGDLQVIEKRGLTSTTTVGDLQVIISPGKNTQTKGNDKNGGHEPISNETMDRLAASLSGDIDRIYADNVNSLKNNMIVLGSIYTGKKIYESVKDFKTNPFKTLINNIKTLTKTLEGKGWGDELRERKYVQALLTKSYLSNYYNTIAENAYKKYKSSSDIEDKLKYLFIIELSTKIADHIMNDFSDVIYYYSLEAGSDAAKSFIKKSILNDMVDQKADDYIREYVYKGDAGKYAMEVGTETGKILKTGTKEVLNSGINKTGVWDIASNISDKIRDDSPEGMVKRLIYNDDINNIINETVNKYTEQLQSIYPGGEFNYNADIKEVWNNADFKEHLNSLL